MEYFRDNPKGYWFKRKLYGWGWTPVKWQGWATTLIFIIILILNGLYFSLKVENSTNTAKDFIIFIGIIMLSVMFIIGICYKKGEKPRWSWGR